MPRAKTTDEAQSEAASGRWTSDESATTVSACEQACARHRWKVPDCSSIAADGCAFSYVAGRVWAVSGGQVL